MDIHYLDKEIIVSLHELLEHLTPDKLFAKGLHNYSNLDFLTNTVLYFPESSGIEVQTLKDKLAYVASYYLFHLASGHVFNDGNKRTAYLSLSFFLYINGLNTSYDENKVQGYLIKINKYIANGKSFKESLDLITIDCKDKKELCFLTLLFDLAAGENKSVYKSPLEIYSIVNDLIIEDIRSPNIFSYLLTQLYNRLFGKKGVSKIIPKEQVKNFDDLKKKFRKLKD